MRNKILYLLIVLATLAISACIANNSINNVEPLPKIGDAVANISWTTVNGDKIDLKQFKGSWVLLCYWCSCPVHRNDILTIQNVYDALYDKNLDVIVINDTYAQIGLEEFGKQNNVPFYLVEDNQKSIDKLRPVGSRPVYLLVDTNGNLHDIKIGTFRSGEDSVNNVINFLNNVINVKSDKITVLAASYCNRGDTYYKRGEKIEAIADFTKAIELDPKLSGNDMKLKLATAYSSRGATYLFDIHPYSFVITYDPNNCYEGKYDEDMARYADSSIYGNLDRVFRYCADPKKVFMNIGSTCYYDGDYDTAITKFTKVIALDPKYDMAYNDRGVSYRNKGEYDKAIADFAMATVLEPKYAFAYYNWGQRSSIRGDYDKAISDLTTAIEMDPKLALAYCTRATVYSCKGENDKAIADYNSAIELDANYALAYYNRGVAYLIEHDFDRAMADCTRAIELAPKLEVAYGSRGLAYIYKGDYDKAIADLTTAIDLDPQYNQAYSNRRYAYEKNGESDKAEADRIKATTVVDYFHRGFW